jgi:pheromone alpha factor receptor
MDPMASPQEFDPFAQHFELTRSDGTAIELSVDQIDGMRVYLATLATTYGAQFGATFTLLLVLLLLTRAEKRKSSIFIINVSCLTANAIRCVLLSCYTTSTLMNPYLQLAGEFGHVTKRDLATTVTANIFTVIVMILVMISLSIQTWVVCVTTAPFQRYIIMGATTIVALVAAGYRAAFVILNVRETLNFEFASANIRIYQDTYIAQAAAIWFFSCIFTYKLGHAIHQRRKLKMPQFGPMQIVFIMGCQTMLIPGSFAFPTYP